MSENEATLESRWQDIQDSRPTGRTGEAREGSTGFAYLMWANNSVERVRVLSRTRFGEVNIQRMVPATTQHLVQLKDLRSGQEVEAYVRAHHEDLLKNMDIPRLPRGVLMKVWGR